jgi:protein gp37
VTTGIEWCDETWNPVTGCTKVSAGCANCYAEGVAQRLWGERSFGDVRTHHDRLDAPLRWRKPRRVFVNSMSDLFHEDVPDEFIDDVFGVMALATNHTFLVLTKRPDRMREYLTSIDDNEGGRVADMRGFMVEGAAQARYYGARGEDPSLWLAVTLPMSNVWLGVSVEDQATADARIPILLDTPAAVRWVSAEPLLGPLDLTRVRRGGNVNVDALHGEKRSALTVGDRGVAISVKGACESLDWIVVGGESGPRARPCDVEWIGAVLRQGRNTGVPVFVKQLGSHVHATAWPATHPLRSCDRCPERDVGGVRMRAAKGGDPDEWPGYLRVREFPKGSSA